MSYVHSKYTVQNKFTNVLFVSLIYIRLSFQFIAARYKRRSIEKELPVNKSRMINRSG